MSGTAPQDLPADEQPGELDTYDALPDETVGDDEVIDISRNEGPELTTGVSNVDTGAASSGRGSAAGNSEFGDVTGGSATGDTVGRGPVPDDEP